MYINQLLTEQDLINMSNYDYATSGVAFKGVKTKGLCSKQLSVLNAIRTLGVCNDRMIKEFLRWDINRVTPRRNEILAQGLINMVGRFTDLTTNKTTMFYKAI